jgi:CBS domain-containing protein
VGRWWKRNEIRTATPEMDVARVAEMMRDRGVDDIMVVEGRYLVGALSLAEAGKADTVLRPAL